MINKSVLASRGPSIIFPNIITKEVIEETAKHANNIGKGKKIVCLWDGYGDIGSYEYIDCASVSPDSISLQTAQDSVFIYACEQDDIGSPFIERLHDLGGKYIGAFILEPMKYSRLNSVARIAVEEELESQQVGGFAKFDFGAGDFLGLIQALDIADKVEGAYVEVGCFQGSSGCAVLNYLSKAEKVRNCYFLDVFDGFDYEDAKTSADGFWLGTHATEGPEIISGRLKRYQSDKLRVSVHKNNIITDELPVGTEKIAVANLDVDLHEAVLEGLRKLGPRISRGGILVVEDPGHSPFLIGARVALDIYLGEGALELFTPVYMDSGQTYLIRK